MVRTTRSPVASRPIAIAWLLTAGAVASCASGSDPSTPAVDVPPASLAAGSSAPGSGDFVLTSPTIVAGGAIPRDSTCDGADMSPELAWTGAPSGTQALVLLVDDPDARDFVHWIVLDLPGDAAGGLPGGIDSTGATPQQGQNDFGRVGWGGPCPPSGTHRYRFTLYALDRPLGLASHPDGAAVRTALDAATVLGEAGLEATYTRE